MVPLQFNFSFDGDFRQVVLKLANTYKPSEIPEHFNVSSIEEYVEIMSKAIAQDFAHQLQPLLAQKLDDAIHQQLP